MKTVNAMIKNDDLITTSPNV